VQTLTAVVHDIWNFFLLLSLIFGCSSFTVHNAFGAEREEFSTIEKSVNTLISITTGEWPENAFDTFQLALFFVVFLFVNSLVLLNFAIAIIVDGYAAAKNVNAGDDVQRGVITDFVDGLVLIGRRRHELWPSLTDSIKALERGTWSSVLNVQMVTHAFAGADTYSHSSRAEIRSSARSFLAHYHKYGHLHVKSEAEVAIDTLKERSEYMLCKIAMMLGTRVPTHMEMLNMEKEVRARPPAPVDPLGSVGSVLTKGCATSSQCAASATNALMDRQSQLIASLIASLRTLHNADTTTRTDARARDEHTHTHTRAAFTNMWDR